MASLIPIVDDKPAPPAEPTRRLRRHPGRVARAWATGVIAAASVVMLFLHLGTYAPWDDEALTAVTARSVWRTGDTSAWVNDHNFMAYRNGLLIRHYKDRYTPPLQFFLFAPFIGLLGDGNFAIRLPSALMGLVTVGLLLRWLWRTLPPRPLLWWAAAFILLTNFEFFLFFRQCRYYGLATLLTTAVAYLYCHRSGRTRGVLAISLVLCLLLSAQYLDYAATVMCLVIDYAIWGRRAQRISVPQWCVLLLPQLAVGAVVLSIWNPTARLEEAAVPIAHHWFHAHLALLGLDLRDTFASGFVILALLLAAPLLRLKRRSSWLLRGPLAVLVFIVGVSAFVTTPEDAWSAEVRYMAPVLPICMGTAIAAVWATMALKPRLRTALLTVAAITVMIGTSIAGQGPRVTSDPLGFYYELLRPQAEPYTPTIRWIQEHVPERALVFVAPDYMTYPLMFRAPAPTYGWQLSAPVRKDFGPVDPKQVKGQIAPDYIIQFGTIDMPWAAGPAIAARADLARRGERYALAATLPYHWQDTFRPERVWRKFKTVPPTTGNEIYIYRRVAAR